MNAWVKRVAWIAGAALVLIGCTLDNVAPQVSPQGNPGGGLVVAAFGRTGAAEFDLYARVKPVHGGRTYLIAVDDNVTPKDFGKVVVPPPGSQQSDWGYVPANAPLERLVVVALPAGDYEIVGVSGYAPRFSGSASTAFSLNSDPLGLRFTVKPGQVSYLGSVVFGFPGWLSLSLYFGPLRVVTADTRERDAKLVRERYAQLGENFPERSLVGAGETRVVRYYLHAEARGGGGSKGM